MPSSEIAGWYGDFMLKFSEELIARLFQSNCTILLPLPLAIYQDFSFPKFTNMSLSNTGVLPIPVVVKWYLTLVLICISKMMNSVKHLMCILRHLYVFLWRMSIQILCPFLNWIFIKSFKIYSSYQALIRIMYPVLWGFFYCNSILWNEHFSFWYRLFRISCLLCFRRLI